MLSGGSPYHLLLRTSLIFPDRWYVLCRAAAASIFRKTSTACVHSSGDTRTVLSRSQRHWLGMARLDFLDRAINGVTSKTRMPLI